jgi:molybdopterin-guanine dinucleotide biosynthesis protein A
MALLGAILAGGRSRRFGTDKAATPIDGVPMIERIHAALAAEVDAVVVCGRPWRDWPMLADMPGPGLGPLGGLLAALAHGRAHGFAAVLSVPADTCPLPAALPHLLGAPPAAFSSQYLIGLWPVALAEALAAHLASGQRSMRSWLAASRCRLVPDDRYRLPNINRPSDLGN